MYDDTAWVEPLREYLHHDGDMASLEAARDAASDKVVRTLLASAVKQKGELQESEFQSTVSLAGSLAEQGRADAGAALEILALRRRTVFLDDMELFAPESKDKILDASFTACERCRRLAHTCGFAELQALFAGLLGSGFAKRRRLPKACVYLKEARDLYSDLASRTRRTYNPYLAATLNNLGDVLRQQRAFPEARGALEKALKIRRDLASREPHIHNPDVPETLNNLGNVFDDQGAFCEAHKAFKEARDIYRDLASCKPDIYKPKLAKTLNNLGIVLSNQKKFQNARKAFKEALCLFSRLSSRKPHIYNPYVAMTLNSLGTVLSNQGEFAKARKAFKQALDIFCELASHEPHMYNHFVAGTLNNLGDVLAQLGDMDAALVASQKAVEAAEAEGVGKERRSLSKHNARMSYRRLAAYHAGQGDMDDLFRYLAAMTEGNYRATRSGEAGGLAQAQSALRRLSGRLGNETIVLIAQSFPTADLFAVLTKAGLHCQTRPRPPGQAPPVGFESFLDAYNQWLAIASEMKSKAQAAEAIRENAGLAFDSLPYFVRDALDPGGEQEVLLSAGGLWAEFPFEALRFGPGETDYVGLHHTLPRIAGISAPAIDALEPVTVGNGSRTAFVAADPKENLKMARDEGRNVAGLLKSLNYRLIPAGEALVGEEVKVASFSDSLLSNPAIVHYAGHGDIPHASAGPLGQQMGEEVLVLHDAPFGPSTLRDEGIQLTSRPFIVLNSCMTGAVRIAGGDRDDLAGSFLARGAAGVVASAFPVYDDLAAIFGEHLYHEGSRHAELGRAFGEARGIVEAMVRQAAKRDSKEMAHWPSWALLAYHGNPYARLPHSPQHPNPGEQRDPDKGILARLAGFLGLRKADIEAALREVRLREEQKNAD